MTQDVVDSKVVSNFRRWLRLGYDGK
jgi:hypothetical protein